MEYYSVCGNWKIVMTDVVAENDQGVTKCLMIYKKRTDGARGFVLYNMIPLL